MTIEGLVKISKLPLFETEILLASILQKNRSFINSFSETKLTSNQLDVFNEFAKRRLLKEPLAYILGYKEFFGINFLVNKNVLIPRSETENLVEMVLDYVKTSTKKDLTLVEVGTGSGAIAISLALKIPNLKILACDINKKALDIAEKNALLHQVDSRIKFFKSDLLDNLDQKIDIITANLPYIPTKTYEKLPEEIRLFEPKIALDSGKNSRTLYSKLFEQAKEKINPDGVIFYEIDGQILSLRNSQFS